MLPPMRLLDSTCVSHLCNPVRLGQGSYGRVDLMSSNLFPGNQLLVAVKTAFLDSYNNPDEAWYQMVMEARVMKFLYDLPSVPQVFGVFRQGQVCCMVQEFIGNIRNMSSTTFLQVLQTGQPSLSALECMSMAIEVVTALNTIHQRGLLHNDVALRNILIHHDGTTYKAKITDFGMACRLQYPREHKKLTFSSMDEGLKFRQDYPDLAPEKYLNGACDSVKGDVYSVGHALKIIALAIGSREMIDLGQACTAFNADDRLSLGLVINILNTIQENEKIIPTCRGINQRLI
ncbi:sperm motility kinase X-like [Antedon mediterranea]|uniref:sperm motility kinase X-like n=1 Tax=Antedon mediterranea TaxID=105859 RepID=UPI003AF564B8